jgi:hypothetical protein
MTLSPSLNSHLNPKRSPLLFILTSAALMNMLIGVVLFERNRRSVKLSAAGERFLLDAKEILGSVGRAKQNAHTANQGGSGSLSVGFMFAAAYSVVPPITLAYLHRRNRRRNSASLFARPVCASLNPEMASASSSSFAR